MVVRKIIPIFVKQNKGILIEFKFKEMYKAEKFTEIKENEILNVVSKLRKENYKVTFNAAVTTNSFYVGFFTKEDKFCKIRISDHDASLNENFTDLQFSEINEIYSIVKNNGRKLRKEISNNSFYISLFSSFSDIKEGFYTLNVEHRGQKNNLEVEFLIENDKYFYKILKTGAKIEIDSLRFLKSLTIIKTNSEEIWK